MKKIISMILIALVAFAPIGAVSAESESTLETILVRVSAMTSAERSTYVAYFRPFITSDAGVDAALANLESGAMDVFLQSIAGPNPDKNALRRFFRSATCIKEETQIRLTYADIFQNKIALEGTSSVTLSGVQKLMNAYFAESPAVQKICTEDGITAGVFANLLTAIPKINGNTPLISFENNVFATNALNQTFRTDFNRVWTGYVSREGKTISYENIVDEILAFLNHKLPAGDKTAVAKSLATLGVCKQITTPQAPGGPGGGPSGDKPQPDSAADYEILKSYPGVTEDLLGGGFTIIRTKTDIAPVITIKAAGENAVIREFISGGTILLTYSYPTGEDLVAHVKPNTVYLVKTGEYPFTDANGWGKSYISALYNRGIVNGKSQDAFAPDANITRAEFVKLITAIFGLNSGATADFADVAETAWYYPYVANAYQNGYVSGMGENQFGPEMNIKRQDMAKIINTVLESKGIYGTKAESSTISDFDTISDYAKDHVAAMCGMGIISGDENKNFNPNRFATREEAAKMIFGMLTAYVNSLKE
ncbi:MAG: S-layer homology domain-containing protein [Clostridia bacterium]|nr:S-layer homology domain-containing protein [Clostridia bacterium]